MDTTKWAAYAPNPAPARVEALRAYVRSEL